MRLRRRLQQRKKLQGFLSPEHGSRSRTELVGMAWLQQRIRFLALRLSGGFKGGYPAAGFAIEALRFITVEFATWAEELGYYTGQDEERIYMGQLSIGF